MLHCRMRWCWQRKWCFFPFKIHWQKQNTMGGESFFISCDTITQICRQNSFEFILFTVVLLFIKAENQVAFYELFILWCFTWVWRPVLVSRWSRWACPLLGCTGRPAACSGKGCSAVLDSGRRFIHPYPGFRNLLHLGRIRNPDPSSAKLGADPRNRVLNWEMYPDLDPNLT